MIIRLGQLECCVLLFRKLDDRDETGRFVGETEMAAMQLRYG